MKSDAEIAEEAAPAAMTAVARLPKHATAEKIDLANGEIVGLF